MIDYRDAMTVLECGEYLVATLNMSTHAKRNDNHEEAQAQKEELMRELRLNILEVLADES